MLLKVHRTLFYLGFFLAISTSHAASSSLDVHSYAIQVAPGIAANQAVQQMGPIQGFVEWNICCPRFVFKRLS
jgi:hypothetical protein